MTESRPTGSQAPLGNPRPRSSASRGACAAWSEALVDLSDGELAHDDRQLVEQHVAKCEPCRAELARLDASLTRLRSGVCAPAIQARLSARGASGLHWPLAASAAAILLMAAAILVWKLNSPAPIVHAPPINKPQAPPAAPTLSPEAALRHIALVEQQARLQTSLDLMPTDAWYADQRAENQRLLTRLQQATLSIAVPVDKSPPEGEAL